jgi:hypothetical protein
LKKIFLALLSLTAFANEFEPETFSIQNYGLYQETNVYNSTLGTSKGRAIENYSNTFRTNSFELAGEKKIPLNQLNDLFLFIKAKGASQVGKHTDPYVEFFDFENEVQRNLKGSFSATIFKQVDNQFYGFGFNEVEVEKVWYMYRDQVSDDEKFINESNIKTSINIGPSYGVVFDGSDHYFFLKASTGYVVVRDDIIDDQEFVNFTVEADYNFLDTYGLYASYKVNLNRETTETAFDGGVYFKAAEFTIFEKEMDVRFKVGVKKTERDSSEYQFDDTQFYIGLEFKF